MAGDLKPIETKYGGCKFRSRLEARWARFWDELGIAWEYEKEGYDLGEAGWYLPDFWLPEYAIWVEVKPTEPTSKELLKLRALVQAAERGAVCGIGLPARDVVAMRPRAPGMEWTDARGHLLHGMDGSLFVGYPRSPEECMLQFGPVEELWPHGYVGCVTSPEYAIEAALSARFEHGESG